MKFERILRCILVLVFVILEKCYSNHSNLVDPLEDFTLLIPISKKG